MQARILAMVLAGGKGARLEPLTRERSKPAVPFGGKYRIVDFVLSNLINSGIYSIYVLTQFKAQSLLQHLRDGWQFSDILKNQFVISVPAQMRKGEEWYQGTSDAIFQNIHLIELSSPDLVAVFSADHVYRMDITQMTAYHEEKSARGTVAALPIPVEQAERFGTIEIDGDWRILRFHEKVKDPPQIPDRPGWVLASMGNYIFDSEVLVDELKRDAAKSESAHDFGSNMLPEMVVEHPIYAYDFLSNVVPGEAPERRGYWRDVGTIEAYYDANMDLRSPSPSVNLHNDRWPLRTAEYPVGPTKFTSDAEERPWPRSQLYRFRRLRHQWRRGGGLCRRPTGSCRPRRSRAGVHRDGQLLHRGGSEHSPSDPRQERPSPARGENRLRPGSRPRALQRERYGYRHRRGSPVADRNHVRQLVGGFGLAARVR